MRSFVWLLGLALLAATLLPPPGLAQVPIDGTLRNHAPKLKYMGEFHSPIHPVAGGARAVHFNFTASDPNGWQDIERAVVRLYAPDNITFLRYATVSSTGGGNGASQDFHGVFPMMYWDPPAMNGQRYVVEVRIEDRRGAWSDPAYRTFEYSPLAALSLSAEALDFGEVAPGERSTPFPVAVRNLGNVMLDLSLSGTDLVGDETTLPVDRIRFATQASMDNETHLGHDEARLAGFLAPGEGAERNVWWALDLPSGSERYVPAGAFTGTVTMAIAEA